MSEYGPIITADESALIFTSRRPGTTGGLPSEIDHNYYEDIYLSKKENGKWRMAVNIGKPVNARTNDAAAGISLDGQKLFVYRDNNGGDLYLSKLKGEKWSKPSRQRREGNTAKGSTGKINTGYHESYASYSYNQKSIFFVSTRKDSSGIGGKDIYQCTLDKKGKCVEVHNLGPAINTPYDETCVFAHPDGKTLYFSSKGHNTMGGYDIFKSTYLNGAWGKAENLGYPINTVDDDVSFSITANNKTGYYSSSKSGGFGGKDIYTITFLGKEKEGIINTEDNLIAEKTNPIKEKIIEPEVPLRKNQLTILKGLITDAITLDPL
ncbi:MAG: peptidoglycan-associated lipoprotein, partial [Bacteroidota bacterium]